MSTIIMNYCWPLQGMTVTQKAVLISLADNANDDGVCWPSVEKIAQRTCLSIRAVRNAIKWLEENQLLQKTERYGRSNIYTITPAYYAPLQEMQPCTLRPQPRHLVHPTPAPDAIETLNQLLQNGNDPTACIKQSIERGWTGLFPIRNFNNNKTNTKQNPSLNRQEALEAHNQQVAMEWIKKMQEAEQ